MLIWLNGTFGVGKTTVARQLCGRAPQLRPFDAEQVGYMLSALLSDVPHADFQDLAPWRSLVPRVAADVSSFTGSHLVAVQTVLRRDYWTELHEGLTAHGLDAFSVLLHCESDELRRRAREDGDEPTARDWRLAHVEQYEEAAGWMAEAADLVIDTTNVEPAEVAAMVLAKVADSLTPVARQPGAGA